MSFEIIAVIVVLNAFGLLALWRNAEPRRPRPNKKLLKSLFDSTPIEPVHQAPKSIDHGQGSVWGIFDEDRIFFRDFEHFASVINSSLEHESRWRVQELPDTELKLDFSDSPVHGRRYAIYHNQIRVGTLEIRASLTPRYTTEIPKVRTHLELDNVQLFGLETVLSLIDAITEYVSDPHKTSEEYRVSREIIFGALLRVMWDGQEYPRFGDDLKDWGRLEVCFEGTASRYRERVDRIKTRLTSASSDGV